MGKEPSWQKETREKRPRGVCSKLHWKTLISFTAEERAWFDLQRPLWVWSGELTMGKRREDACGNGLYWCSVRPREVIRLWIYFCEVQMTGVAVEFWYEAQAESEWARMMALFGFTVQFGPWCRNREDLR